MVWSNDAGVKMISLLKKEKLWPFFRRIDGVHEDSVVQDGQMRLMLGSNNYLSLARNEEVVAASKNAIDEWGVGCTGSRFLNGNFSIHGELEEELAEFFGYEGCLVFPSGFMANQGAIQALVHKDDFILTSKQNHACITDGCVLSGAKMVYFDHENISDLETKLSNLPASGRKLVVVDAVFSMTGELAELDQIHAVAEKFGALLYVDDAHGIGVLGKGGRGTSNHFNIKPPVLMGTFSKSFGSQGGFICANRELIDWIKLKARTFMFSAALSPANTQAAKTSLKIIKRHPEYSAEVLQKSKVLDDALNDLGLSTCGHQSAIVSVKIGNDRKALEIGNILYEQGYFVCPVVYPAVAPRKALLRCSVTRSMNNQSLLEFAAACRKAYDDARASKGVITSVFYADRSSARVKDNLSLRNL